MLDLELAQELEVEVELGMEVVVEVGSQTKASRNSRNGKSSRNPSSSSSSSSVPSQAESRRSTNKSDDPSKQTKDSTQHDPASASAKPGHRCRCCHVLVYAYEKKTTTKPDTGIGTRHSAVFIFFGLFVLFFYLTKTKTGHGTLVLVHARSGYEANSGVRRVPSSPRARAEAKAETHPQIPDSKSKGARALVLGSG